MRKGIGIVIRGVLVYIILAAACSVVVGNLIWATRVVYWTYGLVLSWLFSTTLAAIIAHRLLLHLRRLYGTKGEPGEASPTAATAASAKRVGADRETTTLR